jgi:hypothetical protein
MNFDQLKPALGLFAWAAFALGVVEVLPVNIIDINMGAANLFLAAIAAKMLSSSN